MYDKEELPIEINRLYNAWSEFKQEFLIYISPFVAKIIRRLAEMFEKLNRRDIKK